MGEPAPAPATCRYLDWDSHFFQRRIARLLPTRLEPQVMEQALDWCRGQEIDCLYFLAAGDHPLSSRLACQHGFILVDTRLTLERDLSSLEIETVAPSGDAWVRDWQPSDIPALSDIAAHSFTQTRFHNDPGFSRERAEALYRTWIETSCQGYADQVLVVVDRDTPAGFITLNVHAGQSLGSIALLGVAQASRQRGLGSRLVSAGLTWLAAHGAVRAAVVTAGANLPALRLYQRSGFHLSDFSLWFHKWFSHATGPE
jgi:ribosomal protein S18 acetylase RimI-like enzyme